MGYRFVNTTIKTFKILNVLVFEGTGGKGLSLSEISRRVSIAPNTLHAILKTMIYCGYAAQNEDSTYVAGSKCHQIDMFNQIYVKKQSKLIALMKNLGNDLQEVVLFYILSNGYKIPIVSLESDQMIIVNDSKIVFENIYMSSTGRILTAYASECELKEIIDKWGYPGNSWNGIKNSSELEEACARLRSQAFSEMIRHNTEIISIAVPVFDSKGKMIATIGSYAPKFRIDNERKQFILQKLRFAAAIAGTLI